MISSEPPIGDLIRAFKQLTEDEGQWEGDFQELRKYLMDHGVPCSNARSLEELIILFGPELYRNGVNVFWIHTGTHRRWAVCEVDLVDADF